VAVQATAAGNRARAGQKAEVHSAAVAVRLGGIEVGGAVRVEIKFPQRQFGELDASKSAAGFFSEFRSRPRLPSVSA
jgi:hypothetical protein